MGHSMLPNVQRQLQIRLGNNLGLPTYQLVYLLTDLLLPTYHPTNLLTYAFYLPVIVQPTY
jgi:hypothetical protein